MDKSSLVSLLGVVLLKFSARPFSFHYDSWWCVCVCVGGGGKRSNKVCCPCIVSLRSPSEKNVGTQRESILTPVSYLDTFYWMVWTVLDLWPSSHFVGRATNCDNCGIARQVFSINRARKSFQLMNLVWYEGRRRRITHVLPLCCEILWSRVVNKEGPVS